jgi:hypothetical protein
MVVTAVTAMMMMMVPLHRWRPLFLLPTDRNHRCLLLPILSCRRGRCAVLAGDSGEERSFIHHSLDWLFAKQSGPIHRLVRFRSVMTAGGCFYDGDAD